MIDDLLQLQEEIYRRVYEEWGEYMWWSPRVSFTKMPNELYEITYYGRGYDSNDALEDIDNSDFGFAALLELLAKHASKIKSLIFTGDDEGENGTRNLDFTRLINTKAVFPNLTDFKVRLTDPADHNQTIIAESYDENGQIAALVSMMPNLEVLQVPSAPNEDFFKLENLKLKMLIVQAGYNTQDFIKNLARCDNLKNLNVLDYTNILWDVDNIGTKYEDYKLLFESDFFANRRHFVFTLRDGNLTPEQLLELRGIRKIQFLHVGCKGGKWVGYDG
ncbi:MAG: hypothetical protein LBC08_04745 [Campylobacteraceae bacterium]|jgi:hypothetical protein|nr:hypothetical protein [Campylobacteraceae bacterium]